jgi:hypothetical protein
MGWKIETKFFFSNFKKKNLHFENSPNLVGGSQGTEGGSNQSRITEPSPYEGALFYACQTRFTFSLWPPPLLSSWLLFASPHPGCFTNCELPPPPLISSWRLFASPHPGGFTNCELPPPPLLSSWLLFASPHPGGFTNRELPPPPLLSSWLLFASPHPGGFTNCELPHQATWTPFLYISRFGATLRASPPVLRRFQNVPV